MKAWLAGFIGGLVALTLAHLAPLALAQSTPLTQQANFWSGVQTYQSHALVLGSTGANIVPSATHTLAGANTVPLGTVNIVNAGSASDATALPACTPGLVVFVTTTGSTATPAIWPQAADSIDAGGAGSSTTLTAAHLGAIFMCTKANHWTSSSFGAAAS